jgi:hypothetical protein
MKMHKDKGMVSKRKSIMAEQRYCKICGAELRDDEEAPICLNCQSAMMTSGMV